MRIRYPSSFIKLLLIGFAFAVLPLLWAFANAYLAFDTLALQSQHTIQSAVFSTRTSHLLQEHVSMMERSARQYFVLQDPTFLNNYQNAHLQFNNAIAELQNQSTPETRKQLEQLNEQMRVLHVNIINAQQESSEDLAFLQQFSDVSFGVENVVKGNYQMIDNASHALDLIAKKQQKKLFQQSLVLIPLALLVAGIITFMLIRPIRRMDSAIEKLGKGEFNTKIEIDGPGDLKRLGQRLDWLRNGLNELNQQKQLFLQHVSHELKTPLTAIRQATDLLHDGVGGRLSAQQSEITQILRDNTVKLQKMIENLLLFTKKAAAESALEITQFDLKRTIETVLQDHALSVRSKNLQVETDIKLTEIWADEKKVTLIIDNLFSNAVKYVAPQGTISLKTGLDKNMQVLEVIDNGPGLTQADQEKLFDPFYRGTVWHEGLINSSGLGLAIVKNLTEQHLGKVSLASAKVGAHFIVKIPKPKLK